MAAKSALYDEVVRNMNGKPTYVSSDDSDYDPIKGSAKKDAQPKKRKKTCTTSKRKKKVKPSVKNIQSSDIEGDGKPLACESKIKFQSPHSHQHTRWMLLPPELLSKIFGYVISMEGSALPCLRNLGRVCKHWNSVANNSHLWTHILFSPALMSGKSRIIAPLITLAEKNTDKLQHTRTLSFASLHDPSEILTFVSDHARGICDLSVTDCNTVKSLSAFLKKHGESLRRISIIRSGIRVSDWPKFFRQMGTCLRAVDIVGYEYCSSKRSRISLSSLNHLQNISHLKIEHVDTFKMKFIKDLNQLKVLHLKDTDIEIAPGHDFHHPLLEELNISNQFLSDFFQFPSNKGTETLVKKLCGCPNLRKLSLRGRYVTLDTLCNSLQACQHLRHLDVTIKEKPTSSHAIGGLLSILGHSLEELHIDMYKNLDDSMARSDWKECVYNNLKILSMQSTDIRGHTLLSCLNDRWPMLQVLNVERCRELPRGCKKTWRDIHFFRGLLEKSLRGMDG